MSRIRRKKFMEESNVVSGKIPEYGAIFMSNTSTRKECLRRELFGLPIFQAEFVKQVKAGMVLFLFEFESRELHGVFQASSDGAINIEPNAFRSSGKQFPAQVKFTEKWRCMPLCESEFRHAICENYFTAKKFNFGLSKDQVERLLKLFSLKKVERSRLRETSVPKPTRKSESNLENTAGDHMNRYAEETDEGLDSQLPFRVTSSGDLGHRLTENHGFEDGSYIHLEYDSTKATGYSEDTSETLHKSKDTVGYDISMNNRLGTDSLLNNSNHFVVNDRRVLENSRDTASGWLITEYHGKDGITETSTSFNHNERRSVPLESPYGTNTEQYDPCEPWIIGDAAIKSSSHDLGAPNIDLNGSASYTAIVPSTVQPCSDEHNDTIMDKTSDLGLDCYIPMPTEYPEFEKNTGMIGVESESINGHCGDSRFPGFGSSYSIYPSFANHLSSEEDLSPKNGFNNEISPYREEFRDPSSSIYPSFTHPSENEADLYPERRTTDEIQAFCGDDFESNIQMKDRAGLERSETRKSVFSRLTIPSKEDVDTSPDAESVDEVMAFLNDCHKHWLEQKRLNPNAEDLMLPISETCQDDTLDCEESSPQKLPFIDFKRRSSKVQKRNQSQVSENSPENSACQNKKRKLLRPKLIEDSKEKQR